MTRAAYVLVAVMVCVGSVASVGRAAAQPVAPGDGWVVLPLDDYDALRARSDTRPPAAGPPVEATLTRVDYDLALAGEGTELVYTYDTKAERTGITALLQDLAGAGIRFSDLRTSQSSLEDIFVNLVRNGR